MTSDLRTARRSDGPAAAAVAHPNIALVKYWGKSTLPGNVPAVPSLSITLDGLETRTRVSFDSGLSADALVMNDVPQPPDSDTTRRVSACLDQLRSLTGSRLHARVETGNDFPTGAGLASSASGFAALVVAADAALQSGLDQATLSRLARAASASAARSLIGGFATLAAADTDPNPAARQLAPSRHWPLAVIVAICAEGSKAVGSSEGMRSSALTSPFYDRWIETSGPDLERASRAVEQRDFPELAQVAEASCLKMHAVMQTTRPALLYWNAATLNVLERVRTLQGDGLQLFFTMDAGPQVKLVCAPGDAGQVAAALAEVPGVSRLLHCGLGEGARVVA